MRATGSADPLGAKNIFMQQRDSRERFAIASRQDLIGFPGIAERLITAEGDNGI